MNIMGDTLYSKGVYRLAILLPILLKWRHRGIVKNIEGVYKLAILLPIILRETCCCWYLFYIYIMWKERWTLILNAALKIFSWYFAIMWLEHNWFLRCLLLQENSRKKHIINAPSHPFKVIVLYRHSQSFTVFQELQGPTRMALR